MIPIKVRDSKPVTLGERGGHKAHRKQNSLIGESSRGATIFLEKNKYGPSFTFLMYGNIREDNNSSLKGEIGEIIAKYHFKEAISTKQFNYGILKQFNLTAEHQNFLIENWKSLDLIDPESLTIYEVKTRKFFNHQLRGIKNKIVITPNFRDLCKKAKGLGLSIKIIEITLFDNWKYGFIVKDFESDQFWTHRPRPSGWERQKNKSLNRQLNHAHLEIE